MHLAVFIGLLTAGVIGLGTKWPRALDGSVLVVAALLQIAQAVACLWFPVETKNILNEPLIMAAYVDLAALWLMYLVRLLVDRPIKQGQWRNQMYTWMGGSTISSLMVTRSSPNHPVHYPWSFWTIALGLIINLVQLPFWFYYMFVAPKPHHVETIEELFQVFSIDPVTLGVFLQVFVLSAWAIPIIWSIRLGAFGACAVRNGPKGPIQWVLMGIVYVVFLGNLAAAHFCLWLIFATFPTAREDRKKK